MRPSVVSVCAILTLASAGAQAHAFLDHADPKVGSAVRAAPSQVRLRFTQALELPLCVVAVSGPAGFGGSGPVKAVPGDKQAIAVSLRAPIPPGAYVVRWRVVSADTHTTEGDFTFKVRP
jgi:hypothetical protein